MKGLILMIENIILYLGRYFNQYDTRQNTVS